MTQLPYCGAPPDPGTLLQRFNLDPVLLVLLVLLAALHWWMLGERRARCLAVSGWVVAAAALVSPLCALSVSLFSARVAQHMVLILVAAPLLALAPPARLPPPTRASIWLAALAFLLALWFWHMPRPYDATFRSTGIYWLMHVSLFGSAVWLWYGLLQARGRRAFDSVLAGVATSLHMGLLGAVLACAARPLFYFHFTTTQVWGLSPLDDQQLGGVFMWVPGIVLFLWAALRVLGQLRETVAATGARRA